MLLKAAHMRGFSHIMTTFDEARGWIVTAYREYVSHGLRVVARLVLHQAATYISALQGAYCELLLAA